MNAEKPYWTPSQISPSCNFTLSKAVKWLTNAPIAYESGFLYFRVSSPDGYFWAKVKGKNVIHWLRHLLNRTDATEVQHIGSEEITALFKRGT